jgi:hypothetical protein
LKSRSGIKECLDELRVTNANTPGTGKSARKSESGTTKTKKTSNVESKELVAAATVDSCSELVEACVAYAKRTKPKAYWVLKTKKPLEVEDLERVPAQAISKLGGWF